MSFITIEKFAVEYAKQATAEEKKAAAAVAGAARLMMAKLSEAFDNKVDTVAFHVGTLTRFVGNTAQVAKLLQKELSELNFDVVLNDGDVTLLVMNILDNSTLKAIASGEWNKENEKPQQ